VANRQHSTAVIGGPPEHRDWKPGMAYYLPEIGSDVVINSFVTVDGGLQAPTKIGDRTFLMTKTHVGHDAEIGADCELAPGTVIGGHAVLEDGVRCGVGVLVRPGIRVGARARLGAGAVVVDDVPADQVWVGNPAHDIRRSSHQEAYEFFKDQEFKRISRTPVGVS
jgi:UDP-N-acetylglucosamine acyltransferase